MNNLAPAPGSETIAAPRAADTVAAQQELRLRRFRFAALSYVIATAMAAIAWALGKIPGAIVLQAASAFVVTNLVMYAVIRSGLNLRLGEPSLTRVQILTAMTILMYLVFHMDEGRSVALFASFVVFLFGIFRLNTREFVGVTLFTLAGYAIVILLLMAWRPAAIPDPSADLMAWLGLAGFLPCFVLIGAQINALRSRMRANQARFLAISEMTSDYYWKTDAEHRFTERGAVDAVSVKASLFQQYVRMGERGWDMPSLTPDEAGWCAHRADLDARRPFRGFELSRLALDGSERHMSVSGDPVFGARGEFLGYRGVAVEITARKRAEQALRDNAKALRLFADTVPVMAVSWDANLCCQFANQRFMEFFGVVGAEVAGKHMSEILGDEVYREVEPHFAGVLEGHAVTFHRTHHFAGGVFRHLEVKLAPHTGTQGKILGCFAVTTDITERKMNEERIQRVAHHDSLTGLPNKLLFGDRLEQVIVGARRDSRRFALLYLDLDRFKPVNDTLGHAAGDGILKDVAGRIRGQVRESDTVARVGGDEFTVILPGVSERGKAEAVARKIGKALGISFEAVGSRDTVYIGSSIGVAIYPVDGGDAAALIEAADAAMYRAKQDTRKAS